MPPAGFTRRAGCEDWDLWVRLAKLSPLVYLDAAGGLADVGGQGSTDVGMMLSSASRCARATFPSWAG